MGISWRSFGAQQFQNNDTAIQIQTPNNFKLNIYTSLVFTQLNAWERKAYPSFQMSNAKPENSCSKAKWNHFCVLLHFNRPLSLCLTFCSRWFGLSGSLCLSHSLPSESYDIFFAPFFSGIQLMGNECFVCGSTLISHWKLQSSLRARYQHLFISWIVKWIHFHPKIDIESHKNDAIKY